MTALLAMDEIVQTWFPQISDLISETNEVDIETKVSERDLVTNVDKEVEKLIITQILKEFPTHEILGEESFQAEKVYDAKHLWIIDPIDGTANLVKQGRDYCTHITYFLDNEPQLSYVFDIVRQELYFAIKGEGVYLNDERVESPKDLKLKDSLVSIDFRLIYQKPLFEHVVDGSFDVRHVGCSGLDGTNVVMGRTGCFINPSSEPWDFAPYMLFAKEMDLHLSTLEGEPLTKWQTSSFILCTHEIYEELVTAQLI